MGAKVGSPACSGLGVLLAVTCLAGCGGDLALQVELDSVVSPDPFVSVQTVRVRALTRGSVVVVGVGRWDQGALTLPTRIDPEVERLVVEGLDSEGRVIASGASAPLDLLGRSPDGPISILFTRVGALSVLGTSPAAPHAGSVPLPDGRFLFFGGLDPQGCAIEDTEVRGPGPRDVAAGPRLLGGRHGDFREVVLPGGLSVVTGGKVTNGCGDHRAADELLTVGDGFIRASILRSAEILHDPTAAWAAISAGTLVVLGGEADSRPRTDAWALDVDSLELKRIGQLDGPRASATALALDGGRVLAVGGRSAPGADGLLSDLSVFVPARGASLFERVPLSGPLMSPAVARTRAGGVLVAGGVDAAGVGQAGLQGLVVKSERDFPLGEGSVLSSLSSTVAEAELMQLSDGTFLLLPRDGLAPAQIGLLPRGAQSIELPEGVQGRLTGGVLADGNVLLRGAGVELIFNPGPGASLGLATTSGHLGLEEGGPPTRLPIVPLRPAAWRRTTRGLEGTFPPSLEGRLTPEEVVILSSGPMTDFELTFTVRLQGQAKAAVVFGAQDRRFDFVVLHGAASVERAAPRSLDTPIDCNVAETRSLAQPNPVRVRVRRSGARVSLDVDADGREELACDTPRPEAGLVGFGLVGGTVVFENVTLTVP